MSYQVKVKTASREYIDAVFATEQEAEQRKKYINFKSVLYGIPHEAVVEKSRKKVIKNS